MGSADVTNWLIDEAETVLVQLVSDGVLALQTPEAHVDVAEEFEENTYPFVGVRQLSAVPRSGGLGAGNARVTDQTETDGVLEDVEYATVVDGRFEVAPVTDADPALRDRLGDALASHFDTIVRNGTYGPTVEDVSVEDETTSDRTGQYVRERGVELTVTYTRSNRHDVTAAESVAVDVDAGTDDDADDVDAYDYTYTGGS